MKRSGPPKRKAPLKSTSTLKRARPGVRSGPKPSTKKKVLNGTPPPKGAPKSDFRPSVKRAVRRRSRGWCEMPGCTRAAHEYHHRKMRSAGGLGFAENCLHLCFECHAWTHANTKVAYGHGVLLRRHMTTHPEPVFHPGWRTCGTDHVHGGVDTAA